MTRNMISRVSKGRPAASHEANIWCPLPPDKAHRRVQGLNIKETFPQ